MTISINPFIVDSSKNFPLSGPVVPGEKSHKDVAPITYWGIYMDDKYVSYTSTKELAKETKTWMEKWLAAQLKSLKDLKKPAR